MPCPPLSPNEHYFLYPEPDVQVTKSFLGQPRSESVVVANPRNPHHLICTSKKFTEPGRYHGTISTSFSLDGGKTWKESQPALESGWDGMTDPDLAFDAAGNAYLIVEPLSYPAGEYNTIGIYVYKSTDGGATWRKPAMLHHDSHDDKMWIEADTSAVSPFFGRVYAVWAANTPLRFARSLDRGVTWDGVGGSSSGSDVGVSSCYAPALAIGDDGTIHVTFHLQGSSEIRYTRSTDGGDTFSPPVAVVTGIVDLFAALPKPFYYPQFPGGTFRVLTVVTSCVAANNRLVIAWADFRDGVSRIFHRVGSSGGTTWLGPPNGQPLLPTVGDRTQQHFHPQLAQTSDSALGCAFYEFGPKTDRAALIDVRLALSCDDGDTFGATRTVNSLPWDPKIDAPLVYGMIDVTFIGEYFGCAGAGQSFATVWTDTRTGQQELFYDNVVIRGATIPPLARKSPHRAGRARTRDGLLEPLDLTKQPPRATRATVLGAMFLPRTIDKLRAELPGGNMGPYMNHDRGFSAYVVRRLGLDMDEFRAAVASARNEDDVVAWLRERIDPATVDETNRKLESFTSERMTPDDRALLAERHPVVRERPELTSILDILDAEDARAFSAERAGGG